MKDPMQTMKSCRNRCEEVPDAVNDAVFAALDEIPGETEDSREARARRSQREWRGRVGDSAFAFQRRELPCTGASSTWFIPTWRTGSRTGF